MSLAQERDPNANPLSVIGRYGGKRGRQVALIAAGFSSAIPIYRTAKSWFDVAKSKTIYTIAAP